VAVLLVSCNQYETNNEPISRAAIATDSIILSNANPRIDTNGNIVDAHDGRIIKFEDRYYWYGTSYGETNGFTTANTYHVYSSPDLKSWKKEGKLLPDQPVGVYYRPHVIYNQKTQKYVLWFNWYPQLWDGQFGVATSDTPIGPFEILNDNVQMSRSEAGLGDFGLFVDEDKTAYLSYNTINNHQVSIEKLDEDYTASSLENGGIIAQHMEAGSQFKRGDFYYLLTDYTCCFCNYGSGARVYRSQNPLTGYELTGNINRKPGRPTLLLSDRIATGTDNEMLTKKDSTFQSIDLTWNHPQAITEIEVSLFTGNRPENCGNVDNPRVHPEYEAPEFMVEYWDLTEWKQVEVQNSESVKTALSEKVLLNIPSIESHHIRVTPKADYKFQRVFINEITTNSDADSNVYITGAEIPQRPIIPAQQTYVMELEKDGEQEFIWMGDMWGSASDNIKGHDYQYWSAPLKFREDGTIVPMEWIDEWQK
jgi:hypothetical protein